MCSNSKIKVSNFAFTGVNFCVNPTLYLRKNLKILLMFSFTDIILVLESYNELIDLLKFAV